MCQFAPEKDFIKNELRTISDNETSCMYKPYYQSEAKELRNKHSQNLLISQPDNELRSVYQNLIHYSIMKAIRTKQQDTVFLSISKCERL